MKILIPIILFICTVQLCYSQSENGVVALDVPVRNSLTFNRSFLNPTFSFVREQNKFISITNKRELLQLEDAPQTYLLGYYGRFRENIGAGITFFQENHGVLTSFGGVLNFAYNVRLQRDSNLTFGMNIGAYSSGINSEKVISNYDDPVLQNIPSNVLMTLNPGINYGIEYMDFGLAVKNAVSYNFSASALIEENPIQGIQAHIMFTGYLGGYGFFRESKFSTLGRAEFQKDNSIYSGVVMLTVPKGIWTQVGYNTLYGASGGLGINITSQVAIEYNYEKPFMGLSDLGSSHEITLAYKFGNSNYYDNSRDEEMAGLFSLDNLGERSSGKRKKRSKAPVDNAKTEAQAKDRLAAVAAAKAEATEKARLATEETARLKAAEKARLAAEKTARLEAAEQARLAAEEQANAQAAEKATLAAEETARLEAVEQDRLAAENKAKAQAAEKVRLAAEEIARQEAEEQARLAAEEKAKAEEKARLTDENEVRNPSDVIGKKMNVLANQVDDLSVKQSTLFDQLNDALAIKNKDLTALKRENDLSEQGQFVEPQPFKSVTAENRAIEVLKINLDTVIQARTREIENLESLYSERLKNVPDTNDETNKYYNNTIAKLKNEQKVAERAKLNLLTTLNAIAEATAIERKRRIKRASYSNEEGRYTQDRAKLKEIKQNTKLSSTPLTIDNLDFGEDRSDNIQILKNVANTENGYYLIVAVHNTAEKRNEFLKNVVSSGSSEIDFFYDVNTSKYYIYTKKFETISDANNALGTKENKVYNERMSIIKIEK